jgi:hypothetical protein
MGGFGSGRSRGIARQNETHRLPSIDIRKLKLAGLLIAQSVLKLVWTGSDGSQLACEIVHTEGCVYVSFEDKKKPYHEQGKIVETVTLESTSCNLGGSRLWFRCPRQSCQRRVAILYLRDGLACRTCHGLSYVSQRLTSSSRSLEKAQRIREALEGDPNMFQPFPERPKGCHRKTYERLRSLYDLANDKSWPRSFRSKCNL